MFRLLVVASVLTLVGTASLAQTQMLSCRSKAETSPPASSDASSEVAATHVAIICPAKNAVPPEHPSYARRNHIFGEVSVELSISETGQLEDIKILKSAHSSLSNSVAKAVRQWQFMARGEKYSVTHSFVFPE
ncbi:energy transducer TonB [Piscinibacter gummiphilus]|uniref:Energy transducer TonB n=1 Tax=Piscinibacter gummiphilus TaxID=946333 RepID=A0ABZ0CPH4_9BURK|nr:energy transducer TonB [Piscinibacter gummiphilus]WOB06873.1 energy transducer TonB [Piscinibacter gummiphilus]